MTEEQSFVKADLVKPGYDKVKKAWAQMLSQYYDTPQGLKKEYLKDVTCPSCGTVASHGPFSLNGFRHVTCDQCEVVYVTPRLKDECLERLYNDKYYSEMYAQSMIPAFEIRKKLIGTRKYQQVLKYSVPRGRVLDIGCGIGEVIDVFRENAWETKAIEVNPCAVDWLRSREIDVFVGAFDEYPTQEKFDVIMAWGVVEHVVNPRAFLKKVMVHLNPGGVFVSEVPSGQSLTVDFCRKSGVDPQRIIMGEQHIILYSVPAYQEIHHTAGLEKIHIQTNGLDVETIFRVTDQKVSDEVILKMQECIDGYNKGDLIRGFWRRPLG